MDQINFLMINVDKSNWRELAGYFGVAGHLTGIGMLTNVIGS